MHNILVGIAFVFSPSLVSGPFGPHKGQKLNLCFCEQCHFKVRIFLDFIYNPDIVNQKQG